MDDQLTADGFHSIEAVLDIGLQSGAALRPLGNVVAGDDPLHIGVRVEVIDGFADELFEQVGGVLPGQTQPDSWGRVGMHRIADSQDGVRICRRGIAVHQFLICAALEAGGVDVVGNITGMETEHAGILQIRHHGRIVQAAVGENAQHAHTVETDGTEPFRQGFVKGDGPGDAARGVENREQRVLP